MTEELSIKESFIRLDCALKFAGFVATGGQAKLVINEGKVKVNGEVCTQRGKKLHLGDTAEFEGKVLKILNAG